MKQNGGYITVVSAPGLGATFTLYLPVVCDAAAFERRREPRGEPPANTGATILLVEDEPAVRAIAARSLEHGGFRVLQAPGGADALDLTDRHGQPDLVLTDLMMPGMGGAELARRLRERWPAIPVLFMSGYALEDVLGKGAAGFEAPMLQKPFTPNALLRSVAAALTQDRRPAMG
jgi:two-component system, cell cycle sensor histidine kinase and response regulator CckA